MGGFIQGTEQLFKAGLEKTLSSEAGSKLWEFTGNKEDLKVLGPSAAAVMDMDAALPAARQKIFAQLDAPVQKLWKGIQEDSALRNAHDYKTATIRDIHSDLVLRQHPLAQHTQQILQQNVSKAGVSNNANHTLEMLGIQNKLQSERMASDAVLGPQMQNVVPHIQDLYESPNQPQDKATADLLLRVISNDSRDTIESGGRPASRVALTVKKAFQKENAYRLKYGGGAPLALPRTEATYSKTGNVERGLHAFMVNRLASLAALPHIPMFGNLMSAPISAITKGLATMGDQQIRDLSTASGILAKTQHSMFYNDLLGRTGQAAKVLGPAPATFFYKLFHMPMFNMIRFHQLSLSAAVGYHSAIDWAAQAVNGNKRALAELAEMQLNPQKIIARGGKLTDEEMKQAMFHFVNNRMFIDRLQDRALYANVNPFMRSAGMFHSVITSQFSFMQREIWKMVKAGDIKGLAQFTGTLGILFPLAIPWLHAAEVYGRTLSAQQALNAKSQDYKGLLHPSGAGEFTRTYADMLSYIGGFGVFHSLIKSAWGDRLAATALGPIIGSAVTTAQDVVNATTKPTKTGKHNWNPVGRDISEYSVPIVGKWAGHKFFPTLAEQKEGAISRAQRGRRRRIQ